MGSPRTTMPAIRTRIILVSREVMARLINRDQTDMAIKDLVVVVVVSNTATITTIKPGGSTINSLKGTISNHGVMQEVGTKETVLAEISSSPDLTKEDLARVNLGAMI